jgi:hypothetical protein
MLRTYGPYTDRQILVGGFALIAAVAAVSVLITDLFCR